MPRVKETKYKFRDPRFWLEVKKAGMSGVPDSILAKEYGLTVQEISKKRYTDPEWKSLHKAQKKAIQGQIGTKTKPLELAPETLSSLSENNRLLALRIAGKGLAAALDKRGELRPHLKPNEIRDLKDLTDIAAKAGSWSSEQQVTVNCQAFAGAAVSISRDGDQDNAQIIDNE